VFDITAFGAKPDDNGLQNGPVQAALDACRDAGGGTVVIPAGNFLISGVRIWDNTTLKLLTGAVLTGSGNCGDYPVYDIPDGVTLRTDQEMFANHAFNKARPEYRRAMISAYGARNISIIGEPCSVIDGADCYDSNGEESFRGPHGIFLSNCKDITLRGYTIQNSGNFMHQLDKCENTEMSCVTALAGHDGIHLHCCTGMTIRDCVFKTGDDCIAGADVNGLTVSGCGLNTSCNVFRIGGVNIRIENCRIWGPGYYPHRLTVVKGRDNVLPRGEGRHNTLYFFEYFSSSIHPADCPTRGWAVENCSIEGIDRFLHYESGTEGSLHAGAPLTGMELRDLTIKDLAGASVLSPNRENPLEIKISGVSVSYRDGRSGDGRALFEEDTPGLVII